MPLIHIQTIRRAILKRHFPEDIAQTLKNSLRIFLVEPALFDKTGLDGPAQQAKLVVKLGYWLALGQLTEQEFRVWSDCVPSDDNAGWDVDLLHAAPNSHFRHVLKMGPLDTKPESCLVQEPYGEYSPP